MLPFAAWIKGFLEILAWKMQRKQSKITLRNENEAIQGRWVCDLPIHFRRVT